jgi:transcriptional regulator with XRE-family HTH domain
MGRKVKLVGQISENQNAGTALDLRREAGLWLRSIRERRNLSQRDLASRLDMDYYTFISQIESGRGRVPVDRYVQWADALEIDTKTFAKTLMMWYDPITYKLIFSEEQDR